MPLERLQKVIAAAGVASRRASEALITGGRVTVDGRPARIGDQVDTKTARVEIDGHPVAVRQGNMLAVAFHPEIAGESRIHEWVVS